MSSSQRIADSQQSAVQDDAKRKSSTEEHLRGTPLPPVVPPRSPRAANNSKHIAGTTKRASGKGAAVVGAAAGATAGLFPPEEMLTNALDALRRHVDLIQRREQDTAEALQVRAKSLYSLECEANGDRKGLLMRRSMGDLPPDRLQSHLSEAEQEEYRRELVKEAEVIAQLKEKLERQQEVYAALLDDIDVLRRGSDDKKAAVVTKIARELEADGDETSSCSSTEGHDVPLSSKGALQQYAVAQREKARSNAENLLYSVMRKFSVVHDFKTVMTQTHEVEDGPRRDDDPFDCSAELLEHLRNLIAAIANTSEFHQNVEVELCCRQCFGIFEDPVILWPCGHTFCRSCVQETMYRGLETIECAECGSQCCGYSPNVAVEGITTKWLLHTEDSDDAMQDELYALASEVRESQRTLIATQESKSEQAAKQLVNAVQSLIQRRDSNPRRASLQRRKSSVASLSASLTLTELRKSLSFAGPPSQLPADGQVQGGPRS